MIYVVATITIKPDKREETLAAAKIAIAATQKEAGCISYDLHESVTNPGTYVFVERWESREALTAHSRAEHFKVWRAAGAEGITSRRIEIISDGKVETM
jgi:quinol monooxygenase YgiN